MVRGSEECKALELVIKILFGRKMCIFLSLIIVWIFSFGCNLGQIPNAGNFRYKHLYRPLRITPFYEDLHLELNKEDAQTLKDTVHNVILYVKKILSVIPLQDPLLLERDACKSSWIHGRNVGKCASMKKGYSGEYCLDNFHIPNDHLSGFYTWTNKPLPGKTWFMEGNGIRNTDFVLYIRASTTKACRSNFATGVEHSLVAYASFCKLGKNDRPLAGYMNFCPTELTKLKNNTNKLILSTVHEVFHALGFSKDLFLKFKDCYRANAPDDCPNWDSPIREWYGHKVLSTPGVVYQMQQHFNCDERNFGGPLLSDNDILQSHWNDKILPGTIMTPHLGKPEFTYVDPITLSVFQDSGWYLVNFSNAENYMWGKDKGCDIYHFDENKDIDNESDMCLGETNIEDTFCNPLSTHVMKNCDETGITKIESAILKDCRTVLNNSRTSYFNEVNAHRSEYGRCLLSNVTDDPDLSSDNDRPINRGICVKVKCFSTGDVWVKLDSPNWVPCPYGEMVEVDSNGGVVVCPDNAESVCHHRGTPLYLQDLYKIETTTVTIRTVPIVPNTSQSYIIDSSNRYRRRNDSNLSQRIHQMVTQVQFVILLILGHLAV